MNNDMRYAFALFNGSYFDHVFVAGINKTVVPSKTKADFEDDISLEEFRVGEKCLLYVALNRARKKAYITGCGGMSELVKWVIKYGCS